MPSTSLSLNIQASSDRRSNLRAVARCLLSVAAALLLTAPFATAQEAASDQDPAPANQPAPATQPGSDGFRPGVSILPNSTQGMVAVDNLPKFLDRWPRTSLSDLQDEESLRPFLETQREAIEKRLADSGLQSGIRLSDLRAAVSGELVLAWMRYEAPRRPYSIALLADTRGRDAQREALLKKVDEELRGREATLSTLELAGQQASLYTLPQQRGQLIVERLVVATVDGRLMLCDRPETLEALITASQNGIEGGLTEAADYQGVLDGMKAAAAAEVEAEAAAEEAEASLRWFARPLGMATIVRDASGVDRGRQVDVLKLLRNQGFDAVQSAGGQLQLATEDYDLLHRAFVFAPPTVEGPERYKLAARTLQFPNGEMADPPAWVLPTAASLFQAHWKMEEAFWAVETLVDEAFGEKIFRKVIEDIREDIEGPQIDLANDVVANFDDNLIILTDNRVQDGKTSERVLGAIRLKEMPVVAAAINDAMSGDPDVYKFPYEHHLIWEIRPSQGEVAEFDIEGFEDFGFETEEAAPKNESDPLLERWAVTVYGDHLIFSSHADLLVEIIEHARTGGPSITTVPEFQRVRDAIAAEGGELRAMERIVRTDLTWRIKYELIRQGKFLESDSLLATLLRRAKEEVETNRESEPIQIDASQLPPFEVIRRHLQPAGGFVRTEELGWSTTHFLLRKPE